MNSFSVLISIYKKENPVWFREALDSVFAQTIQPTEIVLVEDGPLTSELYAVIDEYQSKHPIFNIVKNLCIAAGGAGQLAFCLFLL